MEPGGGTAGACAPPQWDPILSFSLTGADPEIRPGGEGAAGWEGGMTCKTHGPVRWPSFY